jgi:hypothetical protein
MASKIRFEICDCGAFFLHGHFHHPEYGTLDVQVIAQDQARRIIKIIIDSGEISEEDAEELRRSEEILKLPETLTEEEFREMHERAIKERDESMGKIADLLEALGLAPENIITLDPNNPDKAFESLIERICSGTNDEETKE